MSAPEPVPCPFCDEQPTVGPPDPATEGSQYGYVMCRTQGCPAHLLKLAHMEGFGASRSAAVEWWNGALSRVARVEAMRGPR